MAERCEQAMTDEGSPQAMSAEECTHAMTNMGNLRHMSPGKCCSTFVDVACPKLTFPYRYFLSLHDLDVISRCAHTMDHVYRPCLIGNALADVTCLIFTSNERSCLPLVDTILTMCTSITYVGSHPQKLVEHCACYKRWAQDKLNELFVMCRRHCLCNKSFADSVCHWHMPMSPW